MSSTDSDISGSISDSSDSSEYVSSSQYLPYEGEPLAPLGDDIMGENSEEADLDGLTPAILESRYHGKNKVDSWCKCGKCSDQNLVGALEFSCVSPWEINIRREHRKDFLYYIARRFWCSDKRDCVIASWPCVERPKRKILLMSIRDSFQRVYSCCWL